VSINLGSLVVKLGAQYLLPILVEEVAMYAAQQALRGAATPAVAAANWPVRLRLVTPSAVTAVLSDTPGRLRICVAGLRDNPARATALVKTLPRLAGIKTTDASTLTGHVLIHYEPGQVTPHQILAAVADRLRAPQSRVVSTAGIHDAPRLISVGS
jgi:hypothetical protein